MKQFAAILLFFIAVGLWPGGVPALPAADQRPVFFHPEPLQAEAGMEVDLRTPLGAYFRPGCPWPLAVRLKSSTDRQLRIGVVPELWMVERQTAALTASPAQAPAAPTVDFSQEAGGDWSGEFAIGAVTGNGAAGLIVAMHPILDDAKRHLVVVELDSAGGSGRYGRVLWRGDLSKYLRELSPDQRLILCAGGGMEREGTAQSRPGIPTQLRLPNGAEITPMLVDFAPADFPHQPAGWQSADLVLVSDGCFDPATGVNFDQWSAFLQHLATGGQAIVLAPDSANHLHFLERLTNRTPPTDGRGWPPEDSTQAAAWFANTFGLPPAGTAAYPWLHLPVGFGTATFVWAPGINGERPLDWQTQLATALAQHDADLRPRHRIDYDGHVIVFDPQLAKLPARLIEHIWWFLALVSAALLAIGVHAFDRVRKRQAASTAINASVLTGPVAAENPAAPTAIGENPSSQPPARARGQWGPWFYGTLGVTAVACVASLYSARERLSAVEWRMTFLARDGRNFERRWTMVNALRTVRQLQLQPRATPDTTRVSSLPLAATIRELNAASGRLLETGAVENFTLEGYRPVLLESLHLFAPGAPGTSSTSPSLPVRNLPPDLRLEPSLEPLLAAGDLAVVLESYPPAQATPKLPTDHRVWIVVKGANGWEAQPLWARAADLNLPVVLQTQEDIYKPGSLKWVCNKIREVTRAPVLVTFRRKAVAEAGWQAGRTTPTPLPLDDSLSIMVVELPAEK